MKTTLPNRKQRHLQVCLDRTIQVESGNTGLCSIDLPRSSIPRIASESVDLSTPFLGYRLRLPVMISCMTGGSSDGLKLNRLLARSAAEHGLAIGTGSIRVMLHHPETRPHFELKNLAPDVPVLANIGAAQLIPEEIEAILEAAGSIGADGLYVHLNAAQEFFQDRGDDDFRHWNDGIDSLLKHSDLPILIKETGAGIPPSEGLRLLEMGAEFIDVAGVGGTDWVAVEALRSSSESNIAAESFRGWGYSTAELLLAYRQISRAGGESGRSIENRIIASGGLRSPRDFAMSLASGAYLGAAALPFIRAASEGGRDAVTSYIMSLEKGIRAAVVLSGAGSLDELRILPLRIPPSLAMRAEELAEEALRSEGVT